MAKGSIDRLNQTLNQILEIDRRRPTLFTEVTAANIRKYMGKILQDDPYINRDEVSEDIAIGETNLLKLALETDLRALKRVTLLLHRVMGYHSSEQTRLYKTRILDLGETRTYAELKQQLARGVRLAWASLHDWLRETLPDDGGALVHYYNQGDDKRLTKADFTESGWCLGVSTQWVRFKATGRADFWTWMLTDEGAAALRFVMAAQEVRTIGEHGLSDRAAFALRRFGVIQKEVLRCDTQESATPQAMANNIISGAARFCRIGQLYVTGGGHAMAGMGGPVAFMDPNAGEMSFANGAGLSSWLSKFIRRMGYHFSSHYVEHYSYEPGKARVDKPKPETLEDTMRDAMKKRRAAMGY